MQRYVPNVTARTRMPPALTASPLGGVLWAQMGGGVLWPSLLPVSFAVAKREASCAVQLDASASGGFATGGRTTQKQADAGNRQKQVLFASVSPQSLRVRLVRWVVGITSWLAKSLNRELDASGGQLAVSHSLKSRGGVCWHFS